jgi:hypothetical protein
MSDAALGGPQVKSQKEKVKSGAWRWMGVGAGGPSADGVRRWGRALAEPVVPGDCETKQNKANDKGNGTMSGNGITSVTQAVRMMQIIRGALVMGVVSFAGVVVFLKLSGNAPQAPAIPNALFPNFPLILLIAAFVAVTCILASFVLPGALDTSFRRRLVAQRITNEDEIDLALAQQALSTSIVRGGLVEAPSLLLCISSLIEGHWWGLMWIVPLVALQLITLPSVSGVEEWIQIQKDWMQVEA